MAREGSKRQVAIEIMNSNSKKSMAEVIALIAQANGLSSGAARSYYTYLVKQGMAKGTIEVVAKSAKEKAVARMVKETVAKTAKPKAKTKAEAVKALAKSPDEIEKIKAANKERMRAVLAKTKQSVKTEDAPVFAETDGFASPAFLSKDEVAALV